MRNEVINTINIRFIIHPFPGLFCEKRAFFVPKRFKGTSTLIDPSPMEIVKYLGGIMRDLLLPNIALGLIFLSATLILSIRKKGIRF